MLKMNLKENKEIKQTATKNDAPPSNFAPCKVDDRFFGPLPNYLGSPDPVDTF